MTSNNLEKVIQRAISDAAFRRQLQSNPEAALRGFKLTSEEVAALRSGDAGRLASLGIDQRMSKVFAIPDMQFASRPATGADIGIGASIADDDATRFSGAANANLTGDSNAIIADATTSRVADVQPFGDPANPVTDPNADSDAMEDQSHAFAATRSADIATGTITRAVRDSEPLDLGGAAATDADAVGTISTVRDSEPLDLGSSAATDADAVGTISTVRDSEPQDLSSADRDAFLPAGEASQYEVDANVSSDRAEDISHAFNPLDATALPDAAEQGHGDALGNTGDPDVTA